MISTPRYTHEDDNWGRLHFEIKLQTIMILFAFGEDREWWSAL